MIAKPEGHHTQLDLCIPYVFGRLNPGNRKQFEAHLATGCQQCSRELAELNEATALLPLLLRQEMPPSGLRQRILSRATSRKPEPSRPERQPAQRDSAVTPATRRERPWYPLVATVFGVLLILVLAYFVYELAGTAAVQEKKIADLQTLLGQKDETLSVLGAERLEIASLSSVDQGQSCYGRILWDASSRTAILQVAGLPAAPEGKRYQLWMTKEKKAYAVADFDVETAQSGLFKTLTLPVGEKREIEEFSITLEPKEGSAQPTGGVVLRSAK